MFASHLEARSAVFPERHNMQKIEFTGSNWLDIFTQKELDAIDKIVDKIVESFPIYREHVNQCITKGKEPLTFTEYMEKK